MSSTVPDEVAAYGQHILASGSGIVGELELVYGTYWYRTCFLGKRPILDLGPGRCWFTRQSVGDILAVDNAPELVEYYRSEGIPIRLGSVYQLPFPAEYFEGIFCCWLLEHLGEPERAMAEMHRVLKFGGYACVIVPSPHDLVAFYDDYTHIRPYTPASLRQLAEAAHFSSAAVQHLPWARGITWVLRLAGSAAALRYLMFSHKVFRKLHLVNRNHHVLHAWK